VDQKRFREVTIMSKPIVPGSNLPKSHLSKNKGENRISAKRYLNEKIIEHLASQLVLGTLTQKVHQRTLSLSKGNEALAQAINDWQARFINLDLQTDELPASELSWQRISAAIDVPPVDSIDEVHSKRAAKISLDNNNVKQNSNGRALSIKDRLLSFLSGCFATPINTSVSVFSVALIAVLSFALINPLAKQSDPLSYVAVLTQQGGEAHLVASTYGESKKLVVNIINPPTLASEQSLELWVVSKTDAQARSLGVIPVGENLIEQQLSIAQWRLIKDSQSLIVTLEEEGGSAIGEPSEIIISQGLCIRLKEWQKNV